jgi:hypothetical protein
LYAEVDFFESGTLRPMVMIENINQENDRIKALADYAIQGGSQYIHMKAKGIKKTIKTEKTISKTSIDNLELSGNAEQVMKALESLTTEE